MEALMQLSISVLCFSLAIRVWHKVNVVQSGKVDNIHYHLDPEIKKPKKRKEK